MFCFLLIFYFFFFIGHCLRPHPFHSLDFNLSRGMNNKYLVNPFFTSEVKTTRRRRSSLPPTFDKPSPLALAKKMKLNGNLKSPRNDVKVKEIGTRHFKEEEEERSFGQINRDK